MERIVRRVFDRNGRCWQRVAFHRPLAPAKHDARCAADAAAGLPRSLRRALGDERGGSTLLAVAAADRRKTLAGLQATAPRRAALAELVAEVRRRFAALAAAARAGIADSSALAAWAAALSAPRATDREAPGPAGACVPGVPTLPSRSRCDPEACPVWTAPCRESCFETPGGAPD